MGSKIKRLGLLFLFVFMVQHFCQAQQVQQWSRFEATFNYAYQGNSFTGVQLSVIFTGKDTSIVVNGFYDGNNNFKIRFMPEKTGTWQYVTSSNIKQLNNKKGSFECVAATGNNHGIVRVSNTYSFKYADGKQFYPVGTTAYAWNHMGKQLQQTTLQSLQKASFNKLRMCVFPKDYDLVKEEPEIYPFVFTGTEKGKDGKTKKLWDLNNFNPEFFRVLEKQIDDLDALGIETDLIVFHPYDKGRWGFDSLPMEVNLRYIKYLASRLSSFKSIWWSVANEWDLVKYKTHDEWITLSKAIKAADPYHHLLSIHGSTAKYIEYWLPEFTHVSIQDEAPVMHWGSAAILRNVYAKPVIYDEVGYEGNLVSRWGRYSGEEMTYLMWMGTIGGTYVTHGESYMFKNETDTIFWAKGGEFKGSSWKRAGFLRKIMEEGPGPLEPADVSRDFKTATAGQGYYIIYFGKEINDSWTFNIPHKNGVFIRPLPGTKFKVEIIDTWDMTVTPVDNIFELSEIKDYRMWDKMMKKIRLPLKPYLVIRLRKIE
jgi:Domain of unknown function (DUF5060)/Domain of unknown function (DUF5605)